MDETPARRLLALVESLDHVCYRYRLGAFAPALARHGWTLQPLVCPRGLSAVLRARQEVAAADVVVLQRRLIPWWHAVLLRHDAKALVYDVDDAVFYRDNNAAKSYRSWRREGRFRGIVRRADAITAGNPFLLDQCDAAAGAAKSLLVPTCVDLARFPAAERDRRSGGARLVWAGSHSTATSLLEIREALVEAQRRLPGMELRLLSDEFPRLPGVNVTCLPWSPAAELEELAAADIGISWLPDHPWSQGKCGLKVLQYMAAGLPVVANPVGVQREMLQHGATGYLVSTPHEWADAIERLATSPQRRAEMGAAGRAIVERRYSVAAWEGAWIDLLDRLTGRRTVILSGAKDLCSLHDSGDPSLRSG